MDPGALVSETAKSFGPGAAPDAKEGLEKLQLVMSAERAIAPAQPPGRQLHAALQNMSESLAGLDWSHVEVRIFRQNKGLHEPSGQAKGWQFCLSEAELTEMTTFIEYYGRLHTR